MARIENRLVFFGFVALALAVYTLLAFSGNRLIEERNDLVSMAINGQDVASKSYFITMFFDRRIGESKIKLPVQDIDLVYKPEVGGRAIARFYEYRFGPGFLGIKSSLAVVETHSFHEYAVWQNLFQEVEACARADFRERFSFLRYFSLDRF